ncbi:MAG: cbb3-type cytochrome c oxidase subunit I [Opitutales bacterium]
MSILSSFITAINPSKKVGEQLQLSRVDESMRVPCVFFGICAVFWLMFGTALALIASLTLHSPDLFPSWDFLTFGRVRSAHLNAVGLGWLNNCVYAICLWIIARLSKCEIPRQGLLIFAGIFWNVALLFGVLYILFAGTTSVEWLELPPFLAPLLAVSYALIGVWGWFCFRYRQTKHVYVSHWYIMAALFWFPSLYIVAQIMIMWVPARGTVQSITNWWFGHNALGLWWTPMGIATAYYLIPKVLGKPVHSYYLSVLGFWSLALFYNWAGVHHLIGGPIPVWAISAGVVASVMMVIPVTVAAINHHLTVVGSFKKVWASPTLRFVVFGMMMYTTSSLIGSTMALREVNVVTHFTHFTVGHAHHGAYGFTSMVMFGGFYFMMPRILQREWPSAGLIRLHFWCAAIGMAIMFFALHIGGWIQGMEMNNPDVAFLDLMRNTVPWLKWRSVSGTLLALGHCAFCANFVWMLSSKSTLGQETSPTLLTDVEEGGII